MTFIVAPSTSFDGVNLATLAGASVYQAKRFTLVPGSYRILSARSASPTFTTSGSNAVLGGLVSGSDPTFLIAPVENFGGDQLISLTGALISRSTNVTGLLGTVSYRAVVLSAPSSVIEVSLSWIVVGTIISQAPTPTAPAIPVIVDGVITGPAGLYRATNATTATVVETAITPPVSVFDFGAPGDTITLEHWTFSLEGPDIVLPVTPQIEVTAIGTLSRSGATVTHTAATWDTGGVTVTAQKVIDGVSSAFTVGSTFTVEPNQSYYVVETASKTGFITSEPAQTATGTRPATSPVFVGSKTTGWPGTVSNQTVSLTDLTGGIGTAPQDGDFVILQYTCASSSGLPALSVVTSGYTSRASLFADDSADTNVIVQTKFMSGTPDTSIQVSGTGATSNAGAVTIMVFRGVNATTPMDVGVVTKTGISSGRPTADPITPTTAGSVIVVLGAAASSVAATVFTSGLSNFITSIRGDTVSATIGAGTYDWISGTYTPAQWLGSNTTASSSWAATTLALRPAT